MFGLGFWEVALILLIALLVLGPDKLPNIARKLGAFLRQLREASHSFQESLSHIEPSEANKPTQQPPPPPTSLPAAQHTTTNKHNHEQTH